LTPGAMAPQNVKAWAQEHFDREARAKEVVDVADRAGVDQLRDRYAAAGTDDNDTELALSAKALVEQLASTPAYLAAHAGEIIECARTVRTRLDVMADPPE